jgi:AcrR family transcriptional regulator
MTKYDKKKEEIKAAGIKSFTAYGYHKTTLEDIAGMLGMKKNSLYYYFESKEALFKELIEDEIKEHISFVENLSKQKITADKKLIKLIHGLISFIRERTIKYTVSLSTYLEISKVINNNFHEYKEKECKYIQAILKEGIADNVFKKHNTAILACDIDYIIQATFRNDYVFSNFEFVNDVDFDIIYKRIDRLLKYVINGIKN